MATVSIPYTFVNGTQNADATQVNSNFSTLASFLNTEVIQRDASVAFTQIPTLPSTTPTNANHATRKGYVDSFFPVTSANIQDGAIMNTDVNANAGIAYSKLALTGSITNTDVNANAGIAYSKLNLALSIVDGDIANATITKAKFSTASNELGGAWVTYTPSTTNITRGASTLSGAYMLIGKTLFFRFSLGSGATATNAGFVSFSLPASLTSVAIQMLACRAASTNSIALANGTDVDIYFGNQVSWTAGQSLGSITCNGVIQVN